MYKWISVDVEADGQIPGDYSMISIGAVLIDFSLSNTFYIKIKPISEKWVPESLSVSGFTREETINSDEFIPAMEAISQFKKWLDSIKSKPSDRLMFVSDNNGFDWQFVNWYFHHFLGENPFGHSSTNLGSFYKGINKSMFANFKHLRKRNHNHNALQDSIGNAEAMLEIINKYNIKIGL